MTRRDKERIKKRAREMTVEELEAEYYKAVFDCLGSQTERMYELGYDMADIMEREKIEDDPSNPEHLITVWGQGYRWLI